MVEKVMSWKWVQFLVEMVEIYFNKHIGRSAAELAYFLILTFFPILICINAFVGLLKIDPYVVLNTLEPFLPQGLLNVVNDYLVYITVNESSALLMAGIVMTLFSASAAMRGLMDSMADIYERESYGGIMKVVASVLFSILLLITIYASMVAVLTGNWFFNLLMRYWPAWVPEIHRINWNWMRFVALWGLMLLLMVLVYRMAAPRAKPRVPVFGGALLASVALVGASVIFSYFIGMSSNYSLVYGSLASVIILLLWLYLCGNIVILGSVFNTVRYRRKKFEKDAKKG